MPLGDPKPYTAEILQQWKANPFSVDVPQAIAGVMTALPIPGTPWPDVEKAKFMAALGAVLDLIYPEPDEESSDPTREQP